MNHRILPPHPPLMVPLTSSPLPSGERQGEGGEDKGEGVWIVVPVFNEATSVGAVVAKACRHGPVIVVDDGSTDGSGAVGLSAGAEVLRHGRRRGKGAALRTGVAAAIGRGAAEILTLDGDGQHDPDEIPRLLEDARRNPRAIVIGGRLHPSGVIPSGRLNALRVSGFFINWLTGTHVQDTQSGFRLYPAELFGEVTLRRGGFVLESEILLAARRAGYDLREVPVTAIHHTGRRSRFHPVRDGCAIGLFLARHALVRLGTEARWFLMGLARPLYPAVARRRHADLALETLPYRASPAQWGLGVGGFTLRRVATALRGWWSDPRARQCRLIGAATLVFPIFLLLTLLHPLAARGSVDLLTPFVRRFYSQARLAQTQSRAATPVAVEVGQGT